MFIKPARALLASAELVCGSGHLLGVLTCCYTVNLPREVGSGRVGSGRIGSGRIGSGRVGGNFNTNRRWVEFIQR